MTTYAIGDVQGCMDSLEALLDRIDYRPWRDHLWLCGDIVNRGPRSLDVLRWAREQGDSVVSVLGNHDLHLLSRVAGHRGKKKRDTLEPVLVAPDCTELIDWLRHRPLIHREGDWVLVHAGLLPGWTVPFATELAGEVCAGLTGPDWTDCLRDWIPAPKLPWAEAENSDARLAVALSVFTRLRMVDDDLVVHAYDGPPTSAPKDLVPWFEHPKSAVLSSRVVFGHWSRLGVHHDERAVCLDSGCVWGRSLTAMRLDDGELFSQPAVES